MSRSKIDLIDELELRLASLANRWRGAHSRKNLEVAKAIAKEYDTVFEELWSLGWRGETLLPDSQLPTRLMPDYYLKHWDEK